MGQGSKLMLSHHWILEYLSWRETTEICVARILPKDHKMGELLELSLTNVTSVAKSSA